MQLQALQNKPGNPLFGHSINEYFVPIKRNFVRLQDIVPISVGSNAQFVETTDSLVSLGKQQALSLVETLTRLKAHDELAIYPIITILEPFFEVTELDLGMRPIPSERIIGRDLVRGTTQPEVTDVREESFFRFLDELEAGAYSADDATTEE